MLISTCLLNDVILGFYYSNSTQEVDGIELASTVTLVLQADQLSVPVTLLYSPSVILSKVWKLLEMM